MLIEGESRHRFNEFLDFLISEFPPATPAEHALIENMAVRRWSLRRIWAIQSAGLNRFNSRNSAPVCPYRTRRTETPTILDHSYSPNHVPSKDSPTGAMLATCELSHRGSHLEIPSHYESRFDGQFQRS